MSENDRRDDIAAAFEAATPQETTPEPVQQTTQDTVVTDTPIGDAPQQELPGIGEPKKERARNPDGTFAKGEAAEEAKKPSTPDKPTPIAAKEPPQPELKAPEPTPEAPTIRPPKSLPATAREQWAKMPAELQQAYLKRDREIEIALGESGAARQFHQKWQEAAAPYEPMFRAAGVDSVQGARWLMQQYAALTMGDAQTKAQSVAALIRNNNIDISLLDSLLAGQAPTPGVAQNPQPYRDPRVDQIIAEVERAKSARQQQVQAQAAQALAEVEGEEFYDDVRDIMADMMEAAASRNLPLTVKDAYNRAVLVHPEVSKVMEQRRQYAAQNGASQKAKAAASSIRSTPASVSVAGDNSSANLRGDLESAWSVVAGRER